MKHKIQIGIIGDYEPDRPSHIATNNALNHCAKFLGIQMELEWLPTETLRRNIEKPIKRFDGLWCAPGEYKSPEGALNAIRFIRENNYPFLGTCAGFQYTVIEYARNKLKFNDVQHAEYNPDASNLIITPMSCSLVGETRKVFVDNNSVIFKYYQTVEAEERFTCRFGMNPKYRDAINASGFKSVGFDENGETRILDYIHNRFYVITLFQPQLNSSSDSPHKLILAFLVNAVEFHDLKVKFE
jgi:CTP synthase (UTP-ammonia lyase)